METNKFEFDEFLLDTKEKVLLRDGKPVSITPKTYWLLLKLVENHGRLVEKEELMNAVWADSFVEEGNLAFTMRLLRVALGDEKRKPRFIETVSRRGYRFIAEVRTTSEENGSNHVLPPAAAAEKPLEKLPAAAPNYKKALFPALAVLTAGAALMVYWIVSTHDLTATATVLSEPFASEKLSTNGKVFHVAISPDGKNVVYTNKSGGRTSVWLRQLESANNTEILPPSEDFYGEMALSADGNFLYFTRRPIDSDGQLDIYRVPIFGGVPVKVISEAQGYLSLSPDGAKISFVRCYFREDENCSLWIADSSDGKNEKKLVSRPRPVRIGDNKFSPDGRSVAFAAGQSQNAANEFALEEVEIESGQVRELTAEKFFNIKSLVWMPFRSDLLVTAAKIPNKHFRIWQVSTATGETKPLTKDSETYSFLSLDKTASRLIATQVKQDFQLRLFRMDSPSTPKVLADASNARFMPTGKIVFSSIMSGNDEIWSIEPDGSGQRQLTNHPADDVRPIAAPAGDFIFFVSNRTGQANVWRIDTDGSNPLQITQKDGGFPVSVSPDGKWVYYQHGIEQTLWRASSTGGDEQLVLNKRSNFFALSPDGARAAFYERQGDERLLTIVSLDDGQTVKTFPLGERAIRLIDIVWLPDGKTFLYTLANRDFEKNTLWRQTLDGGEPQKIADLGDDETGFLTISPDGKSFAVVQGRWKQDAVLLKGLK